MKPRTKASRAEPMAAMPPLLPSFPNAIWRGMRKAGDRTTLIHIDAQSIPAAIAETVKEVDLPTRTPSLMVVLRSLFHDVGQVGEGTGPLDAYGERALVLGAGTGYAAGKDLAPVGGKAAEDIALLVVDLEFLGAELADLLLEKALAAAWCRTPVVAVASGIAVIVTSGCPVVVSHI
jgi:hypothetical protein